MQGSADDILALEQLAARYWARADGDVGQPLEEIFTPDAALVLGSLALEGLPAIEAFFRERDVSQQQARRTTRHIACNHLVSVAPGGALRLRSTVLVYVGTGEWPMPSGVPAGIADFDDICVKDGAGWRFRRRAGRTVFTGPGAAKFAR
jgi:hypothetical protein